MGVPAAAPGTAARAVRRRQRTAERGSLTSSVRTAGGVPMRGQAPSEPGGGGGRAGGEDGLLEQPVRRRRARCSAETSAVPGRRAAGPSAPGSPGGRSGHDHPRGRSRVAPPGGDARRPRASMTRRASTCHRRRPSRRCSPTASWRMRSAGGGDGRHAALRWSSSALVVEDPVGPGDLVAGVAVDGDAGQHDAEAVVGHHRHVVVHVPYVAGHGRPGPTRTTSSPAARDAARARQAGRPVADDGEVATGHPGWSRAAIRRNCSTTSGL